MANSNIHPSEIEQYWKLNEDKRKQEPCYCRHFGCGKKLMLEESLCGDHCIDHIGKQKIDPTRFAKFK